MFQILKNTLATCYATTEKWLLAMTYGLNKKNLLSRVMGITIIKRIFQ